MFNFCLCSCCSRRTPRMRCVFANATFTGGRATARSHENRRRGVVLSYRARWHMRGGMRVPCHVRAPQQREQQRSRFLHWGARSPTGDNEFANDGRVVLGEQLSSRICEVALMDGSWPPHHGVFSTTISTLRRSRSSSLTAHGLTGPLTTHLDVSLLIHDLCARSHTTYHADDAECCPAQMMMN